MENDLMLPEGAQVYIVVVEEPAASARPAGITGAELAESEIVGMWADREDITDSAAFAEELRRKAERRGRG
ncbi:MAG: hypothetical protein JXJ17_12055 [Anaerolineae bacterium]|nr:hypothetical protein [Anaerolineae bacterium]